MSDCMDEVSLHHLGGSISSKLRRMDAKWKMVKRSRETVMDIVINSSIAIKLFSRDGELTTD